MLTIEQSVGRMHWKIMYCGSELDIRPTRKEAKEALKEYTKLLGVVI
jgi:hypothetical protein